MSLKKRFICGVLLSALIASWAYYAEYLPFTGKWIASCRMDQYAKERYPGFRRGKVYFNPCGAPYETTYTGDSGQEVALGCGFDGWIGDPARAGRWRQDSHAEQCLDQVRIPNSSGWINCGWAYDAPETDAFTLCVQIMESEEVPFPESETALREKMAEILVNYWDALPETAQADVIKASVTYSHYATEREKQQPFDDIFYTIHIPAAD